MIEKQVSSFSGNIYYGYYVYYDSNEIFIWHREDGPAIIRADGTEEWYINDKRVTSDVEEWLHERKIENYKDMPEEDKLALSFFMMSKV